ncbi:octanoyltransferase [Histoplasma capsulatum var. duboisii H88]|uniref:Octanoyltransferase n=1 Tax=Ajellomyces capsulatus (strain H88) TaxID=544711 RepID=F0UFH2_AJEC8|nr:octanoyltransferase [Histoplasma capsulatum var. duboisii H88]QSS54915.1 octanoyltransferase [Histoplasma capsulatum var. duboisii H88]
MRLAHLHIPNLIPFAHASHLQQILVSRLLTYKKLHVTSPQPPPDPTILTFTPLPVYTTGRRDLPSSTSPAGATSTNPHQALNANLPKPLHPIRHLLTPTTSLPACAEFHPTLRGGQTTYHGPGQLVIYTILDLQRLCLGPRQHIQLLERSVLDVLASYGVQGAELSQMNPGVWVCTSQPRSPSGPKLPSKKIAAVGVHLRRNISSYGVGLNVTEEPMWFFRQIVACGLEGREATSMVGCGVRFDGKTGDVTMLEVAERFVNAFVSQVNEIGMMRAVDNCAQADDGVQIEEVYNIEERDVLEAIVK